MEVKLVMSEDSQPGWFHILQELEEEIIEERAKASLTKKSVAIGGGTGSSGG